MSTIREPKATSAPAMIDMTPIKRDTFWISRTALGGFTYLGRPANSPLPGLMSTDVRLPLNSRGCDRPLDRILGLRLLDMAKHVLKLLDQGFCGAGALFVIGGPERSTSSIVVPVA